MKIHFLGTSGAGIQKYRNLPAILLNDSILIDCGEGCLQSLMNLQIPLVKIKAIFLTHLHADHCLGLVSFLWQKAFYERENHTKQRISLPIYVPQNMKTNLMQILNKTYSSFENVLYNVNIIELPERCENPLELTMNEGKYKISWQKTMHNPLCYALKFNNQVVLTGDTGPFQKLIEFCNDIDIVIHEATFFDAKSDLAHSLNHSTPSDAATLAKKAGVKTLILTHLPEFSTKEETHFLKNAKEIFSNIYIAQDDWILDTNQILNKR